MANHGGFGGNSGSAPGGGPGGNHEGISHKQNDAGDKPKSEQAEAQPINGQEFAQAGAARTNASDGSLRKYSQSILDAQEASIELVGYNKVVSRTKPGNEKDLLESKPAKPAQPHAPLEKYKAHLDQAKPAAVKSMAPENQLNDLEVAKKLTELARLSPQLDRLTKDAVANIKKPECLREFTKSLDQFHHHTHFTVSQAEKNETYKQLCILLEAKSSKLRPPEKYSEGITWTPERAAEADKNLRAVLATELICHAANPNDVNQGAFGTCNVSAVAEHLFSKYPSRAAAIVVSAALHECWRDTDDGKLITIDPRSLCPAQGTDTTAIPINDQTRSFDMQLLNVVMINDITQRYIPPQIYVQHEVSAVRDPVTKKKVYDGGERLYAWDPVAKKKGDLITTGGAHGKIEKIADETSIGAEDIAILGCTLSREDSFMITTEQPPKNAINNQYFGLTYVQSCDQMKNALLDMKKNNHFPIIVTVDAASPIFGRQLPPGSGHIVSVTSYNESTGRVRISNQWGKEYDIEINVTDLYDASNSMNIRHDAVSDNLGRWKFELLGNKKTVQDK